MNIRSFVNALPKAELHLHLEGSVDVLTFCRLAKRNGVELPAHSSADDIYSYDNLTDFLRVYELVSQSMIHADDFHVVCYEALARVKNSGGRYVEFFFSPQAHWSAGVSIETMFSGILKAMEDAETDFGIVSRVIPAINRELGVQRGSELLELVLPFRSDKVIGIGLDFDELPFPPAPFKPVYDKAKKAGLRRTIHSGWDGPPDYVRDSLDVLSVERIDHGYRTVEDADLVARCRAAQIPFTVCPTSTAMLTEWRDLRSLDHPIRTMLDAGLTLVINSDDPGMLRTNLAREYGLLAETMSLDHRTLGALALNSIDVAWLDDSVKRNWRAAWSVEIDTLVAAATGDQAAG